MPGATNQREAVRARWNKPETVEKRVDALAETIRRKIDKLPPLTAAQRERLAALLRPGEGSAST
jgi:hypothetical protein